MAIKKTEDKSMKAEKAVTKSIRYIGHLEAGVYCIDPATGDAVSFEHGKAVVVNSALADRLLRQGAFEEAE